MTPGYDPDVLAGDCQYSEPDAQFALDFVAECCALDGEPLRLMDWQQAILSLLWGWRRPDHSRRFREALV